MDPETVLMKELVDFGEPQGHVTRSLMPQVGQHLMTRSEGIGQTKRDPKYSHESTNKD